MSGIDALVAGDAAAFEQLCAMLMSSQNEQRSQVGGMGRPHARLAPAMSRMQGAAGGSDAPSPGGGAAVQAQPGRQHPRVQPTCVSSAQKLGGSRHGQCSTVAALAAASIPQPPPASPTSQPRLHCWPPVRRRLQAEAAFAELKKHPDACAQQLVRALRQSPSLEARALCAVLLRKVGCTRGSWSVS